MAPVGFRMFQNKNIKIISKIVDLKKKRKKELQLSYIKRLCNILLRNPVVLPRL